MYVHSCFKHIEQMCVNQEVSRMSTRLLMSGLVCKKLGSRRCANNMKTAEWDEKSVAPFRSVREMGSWNIFLPRKLVREMDRHTEPQCTGAETYLEVGRHPSSIPRIHKMEREN